VFFLGQQSHKGTTMNYMFGRSLRTLPLSLRLGAFFVAASVAFIDCGGDDTTGGGTTGTAGSSAGSGGDSAGAGGSSTGSSGSGGSGGSGGSSSVGGSAQGGTGGSGGSGGAMSDASTDAKAEGGGCSADLGYALQFRGTGDDRVHAEITKLPINQESRTVEMWAYFDGSDLSWHNEHGLFEYGQKGGCHEFAINSVDWPQGGQAEIHPYGNCDEIDNFFNMPSDVQRTGWVHVAFSYDAAGKQFHFAINGSEMIQNGLPANRTHPNGNWPGNTFSTLKSELRIGTTDHFAGPPGWQGKIDEVRVWNVYRTPQQVKDNMRVILKGNEPGLVAYYHFDEGTGLSSKDATGDAMNNAVFVGTDKDTWPKWVKSDIPGSWTCAQ
jgi:Concanavalin A-like lectin/glucanases superfamily